MIPKNAYSRFVCAVMAMFVVSCAANSQTGGPLKAGASPRTAGTRPSDWGEGRQVMWRIGGGEDAAKRPEVQAYKEKVRTRTLAEIRASRLRDKFFTVDMNVWITANGRIERVNASTGDSATDEEIRAVLISLDVGAPPPGTPMPVMLRMQARPPVGLSPEAQARMQQTVARVTAALNQARIEVNSAALDIQVWVTVIGRIERVNVSTGDPVTDERIRAALMNLDVGAPPPGAPMPMMLRMRKQSVPAKGGGPALMT